MSFPCRDWQRVDPDLRARFSPVDERHVKDIIVWWIYFFFWVFMFIIGFKALETGSPIRLVPRLSALCLCASVAYHSTCPAHKRGLLMPAPHAPRPLMLTAVSCTHTEKA